MKQQSLQITLLRDDIALLREIFDEATAAVEKDRPELALKRIAEARDVLDEHAAEAGAAPDCGTRARI